MWFSDACILVTGVIAVKNANNADLTTAAEVVSKNCAAFKNCRTEINETFADEASFMNITISMYNLIEYSDNYSDTSGSLW